MNPPKPTIAKLVVLVVVGFAVGTSALAWGQDRGTARSAGGAAPSTSSSGAARDDAASTRSQEVSEGGSKVKVITFTGFDISGRLKSPQLLYFLNRMRAEFERPRLPHRSFMPELERSTHGKAF